jgi:hypothetical protein
MGEQSLLRAGEVLSKRLGIYGGYLNRRRRATRTELAEWIRYYQGRAERGEFCPKRAAKIIAHFQRILDRIDTD